MNKVAVVFPDIDALTETVSLFESRGLKIIEIYSPVPLKGYVKSNPRLKNISAFSFIGAVMGLLIGLALQYGATNIDYSLNLGGRPFFHLAWSVPLIFELAVLCSALSTFVGFLFVTSLPRWYPDIGNMSDLHDKALNDKFVLIFDPGDKMTIDEFSELLKEKNAVLRVLV